MNLAATCLWIGGLLLSAVPPLTPDQSSRLTGAVDGTDYHDEAFLALVENVRLWSDGLGDAPIRLKPDFATMRQKPEQYRGELCRVAGELQQSTRLSPPFEDVNEWFVRTDGAQVLTVYVVGADRAANHRVHDAVEIDGRFYKRMDFTARDGQKRSYAAFVGAFPRTGPAASSSAAATSSSSVVASLIVLLAIVFIGLLIWARRSSGGRTHQKHMRLHRSLFAAESEAVDEQGPLPDDPAQALSELKRRADSDRVEH